MFQRVDAICRIGWRPGAVTGTYRKELSGVVADVRWSLHAGGLTKRATGDRKMPQGKLRGELRMWRWIHPEKQRYYQADLVVDLFGDWTMIWAWGGLGSKRGRRRITGVADHAEGMEKIMELDAYRQKRGYLPVESFADWRSQVAVKENAPQLITQQVTNRGNGLSQELDFG